MDKVFARWLERQFAEGMSLAAASDVLTLVPEPGPRPPCRFVAAFRSPTMVRTGDSISRHDGFAVLLQFAPDYLRAVPDVAQVVNVLAPGGVFHPNVMAPLVCIGHIVPGTGLVELTLRVHELLTFQRLTPREDNALNPAACAWARRNAQLLPLRTTPLRRRTATFTVEAIRNQEMRNERD